MGKINAVWHRAHPMPKNPTMDERIEWHQAHAKACGCRAIHGKILEEMKRRGIEVPSGPTARRSRAEASSAC
jgi:hypothetical protein